MSFLGGAAKAAGKKAGSAAAKSAAAKTAAGAGKAAATAGKTGAAKVPTKRSPLAGKPAAAISRKPPATTRTRSGAPATRSRGALPGTGTSSPLERLSPGGGEPTEETPSLGGQAKGLAKDVAKEVATSAAVGAATGGGLPGAAVGAAKGLAVGFLKNKLGRTIIFGTAFLTVLLIASIPFFFDMVLISVGSGLKGSDKTSSAEAAVAAGADKDKVQQAAESAKSDGIPWMMTVAYNLRTGKDINPKAVKAALEKVDPTGTKRDLTAGAVYSSSTVQRKIGKSGDSKAAADGVRKTWTAALVATGVDQSTADAVYDSALVFALGQNNGCSPTSNNAGGGSTEGATGQLSALQIANAIAVMGMAKTMFPGDAGIQQRAATIGIQVAIQEHGLLNTINENGDTTYVGMFQQIAAFGTIEQRQDPAYASATFFNSILRNNPTWASMDQPTLTLAMARQQFGTGQPESDYQAYANEVAAHQPQAAALVAQYFATAAPLPQPAIKNPVPIQGVTPGAGGITPAANCTGDPTKVNGTSQQIAQLLVTYEQQKKLTYWTGAPFPIDKQITNVANGTATSQCQLAPEILGLIATAVQTFGTVQINDLNRRCSGEGTNAAFSAHFYGNAVDFGAVAGHTTSGNDAWSIALVKLADTLLPPDSGAGQDQCRAHIGGLKNITRQFFDPCNHQHIDIGIPKKTNAF